MPKRIPFEAQCYYHIYNRGLHKQTLFFSDKDCEKFLWYLEKGIEKYKNEVGLIAYCILPNHFHLVLLNKKEGFQLSSFVGTICMSYVKRYQAKHQTTNKGTQFFESRFHAKKIDSEEYLRDCIYYVEHNALKHELVDDMQQRPFSSWSGSDEKEIKKQILAVDWEF